MRVIAALLVAIAAGAWTASTGSASAGGAPATNAAGVNQAAAHGDAAVLLARLTLPAGAVRSATEPSGAGAVLAKASERPATQNVVDDHGWWVISARPAAVLAFIRSHPPAGSKLVERQSGDASQGFILDEYSWPARAKVLSSRQLVVEVVSLAGGSTALRADAFVVWMKPRPASERIPGGVAELQVTVINGKRPTQGPFTFALSSQLNRVRSVIDALPAAQPGVALCPADFAIRVRLAFYSAHSARPLAVARVDPDGCEGVQLTVNRRSQPPLSSAAFPGSGRVHAPPLVNQLDRILGVKLAVTGP